MAFNSYTGVNIPFTASNKQFIKSMQEARGAIGGFVAESSIGLTNAYSQMDNLQRKINSGMGRAANSIKNFGSAMTTYLTLPMSLAGAGGLSAFFDLDAMAKGLDVVTGSTERTANYMKQFLKDAAMPGLGYKEVVQHGNSWLILGDNIQTARKKMQEFGNALALEGKGKDVFATINYQLIQMANKGKVMAEDLKPILNSSAVIAKTISDRYRTTDSGDIQKILEKQGIGSKGFIDQLVQDLSKLDRVVGGAKNSWENFTDSLFIAAAAVGDFIDKGTGFQSIMDTVGNALRKGAEYLNEMPLAWKQVISGMAMATLVAGPLLTVFGSLIKAFVSFTALGQVVTLLGKVQGLLMSFALTNPAAAGVLAVAAAFGVLTLALSAYSKETNVAAEAQKNIAEIRKGAILDGLEEHKVLDGLVATARDKKKADWERAAAIKKLNEYAPEYLGNLTQENINTKAVVDQLKNYKIYILAKIQYDALATEFSLKSQDVLRLKKLNPEKNIGFMDYVKSFISGTGASGLDFAKHRIRGEMNDSIIGKNAAFNDMNEMERKMNLIGSTLSKIPTKGGAIEQAKASMKDLNSEIKATVHNLDALEKEITQWNNENGFAKWEKPKAMNYAKGTGGQFGSFKQGVNSKFSDPDYIKNFGDGTIGQIDPAQVDSNLAAIGSIYQNGLYNIAGGIADGLGLMTEAWVNGTFKWQDAISMFLGVMGDAMKSMGQGFVSAGTAKIAADLLKTSSLGGGALIAIGAGLIATGGALKGASNNKSSVGSVGGYASPTYSGTTNSASGGASTGVLKIDLNLNGTFRVAGSDLVLAINRQTTLNANI